MQTSAHDGSLNPIRDDIKALGRRIDKLKNRRKLDRDEVRELRERLDVVMSFLDGMYNGPTRRFHKVELTPAEVWAQRAGGEEDA